MYEIKTDTHMHTICSGHAYSTIEENVRAASEQGMEAIGITDHFSGLFVSETTLDRYGHFGNYAALPKEWYGVRLFSGAETDIVDLDGRLFGHNLEIPFSYKDRKPTYQQWLTRGVDYQIASIHARDFTEGASLVQTTEMYCKAMDNPKVLIIGHIGRAGVPFDLDTVLLAAKEKGVFIEINEASLGYPEKVTSLCRSVAVRCAELGVSISVGSDAHASYYVGKFDKAQSFLSEIHFPQELIGTRNRETFSAAIERRSK